MSESQKKNSRDSKSLIKKINSKGLMLIGMNLKIAFTKDTSFPIKFSGYARV